ncbi:MAG: quinolinate synthase [Nitrospirota bacterium]|nr:quinolinate synthase [Nitrospirota bacterium]MDH5767694.1 quinolinate synthase [Nitrospirota bacterium]
MSPDRASLQEEILKLKEQRRALILSHNYQRDEVQDIADFVGDSLELSRTAASIDCEVIVFAGVNFMAESASILSPNKTVLLTEIDAGCPMADMIHVDSPRWERKKFPGFDNPPPYIYPPEFTLRDIKAQYPGVPVVAYVNTTADVKAESDICCTSANVVKVIESLPDEKVICIPDRNLSMWAQRNTKKQVIAWDGYCNVHERVTPEDVKKARAEHPNALVIAHPECRPDVLDLADHVTSTSGMLRFASASSAKEFIIGTEIGLLYRLRKENPDKIFYPLRRDMICPNMKKTTLHSVLRALRENNYIIKVPEEIRVPAKRALDRMLEVR